MARKIYLICDLEGVAGVCRYDDHVHKSVESHGEWMRQRLLMTREVNAAIEGFLRAGATDMIVYDSHGRNESVLYEQLHARARLVHGHNRHAWLPGFDATYQALAFVGAHPMAGVTSGHLAHTYSRKSIESLRLGGQLVGEIDLYAAAAASLGVPFVLCTGDAEATREAASACPGVVTLAVKHGIDTTCAVAEPSGWVIDQIREAAARAAAQAPSIAIPPVQRPFRLEATYRSFQYAWGKAILARKYGARLVGWRRVRWEGSDLLDLLGRFKRW